jgi:beta-N-acetylhexosaminidase
MAGTGKHFPGHGAVAPDSHLALPVDERDLDSIKAKDLLPFIRLIAEGLEGIMPAHVVFSAADDKPAGFSPFWIQHVLREELQFTGAVFSDDLSMAGASWAGDYPERAGMALAAGCDMVLVCNNPIAAEQVLEALPVAMNPLRDNRLAAMRGKPQFNRAQLLNSVQWRQISDQINHTFHSC